MNVLSICEDKLVQLQSTNALTFSAEEIEVLLDKDALRVAKLVSPVAQSFKPVTDLEEAMETFSKVGSVETFLNMAILYNPVLTETVTEVYKQLRKV